MRLHMGRRIVENINDMDVIGSKGLNHIGDSQSEVGQLRLCDCDDAIRSEEKGCDQIGRKMVAIGSEKGFTMKTLKFI